MIEFNNTRVYNFMGAIQGMRNSWGSHEKSDSFNSINFGDIRNVEAFGLGDNDRTLALKLVLAGSDHAKFLRQILISVDVSAGNEFWKELDTYKVGTVANSSSLMHTCGKRLLNEDDFSFDKPLSPVAESAIENANFAIREWWDSGKKVGSSEWRDMQKSIPMGFIYHRAFTANYQVLRNIYFSRKNHRLAEWHDFCAWIESLPYSELITHKKEKRI